MSACNIYVFLLVFTHEERILVNLLISRILEEVNVGHMYLVLCIVSYVHFKGKRELAIA